MTEAGSFGAMRAVSRFGAWLVAGVAVLAAFTWLLLRQPAREPTGAGDGARIVSLSPALTETLFAIGAAEQVVGVSDYCDHPPAARARARVGTSITPNFEAIVRLTPTLIVTEDVVNARPQELERLAPTVKLPWLSLDHVVRGTRRLGELSGKQAAAQALAARLEQRLSVTPPPGAPRVLLVLGYATGPLDEVWFIRRNSLHGAALQAAGGQNAVARDVAGQPRLSLEKVLELDPDIVVVLVEDPAVSERSVKQQWRELEPLRAVRENRIAVLQAPEAFSHGPRILELTERLQARLEALSPP